MSILKLEPQLANSTANFAFGNVFASNFYYANGQAFSGGSVKFTATTTPPSANNSPGDQWFNTTSQTLYEYINDGTGNYWVDVQSPTISSSASTIMQNGNSSISLAQSGNLSINIAGTNNVLVASNTGATVSGGLTVSGTTSIKLTSEVYVSQTGATGVVSHDLSTGGTFYHTNPLANFTANFTNVPTTDSRIIEVSLIISQAGTAYMPTTVQIDGSSQTVKWLGSSTPSGNASKTDIVTFKLQRVSSSWVVYGQSSVFG